MSVTGLKIATMAVTKTVALVQVGVQSTVYIASQFLQPLLFFGYSLDSSVFCSFSLSAPLSIFFCVCVSSHIAYF